MEMQYHYVAYNLKDGIVKGRVEASDEEEVRSEVLRRGYKPLRVKQAWQPPTREELFPSLYAVKKGEMIRATRQMATMIGSGASLQRTLELTQAESSNPAMQRVVGEIRRIVDEGGTLSSALAEHPNVFDPLYVSIVQVGEFTGRLAPSLDQLAEMMERSREAKQKLMSTMAMPMFNLTMAGLMLLLMTTVILPPIFENFDEDAIPLLMRIMIGVTGGIGSNPIPVFGGLITFIASMILLRRIPSFRIWMDGAKARAPIIGPLTVSGELANFSLTMSMLLRSGVSLAESLQLGINGTKNQAIRRAFVEAEESLVSGQGLSDALERHSALPRMWVELIRIGEQSNTLGQTMTDLADVYQKKVEGQLNSMVAILEPVATLAVGGVVLLVALSTIGPIQEQMKQLAPP